VRSNRDCGGISICIYMSIKLLLLMENKAAVGTRDAVTVGTSPSRAP